MNEAMAFKPKYLYMNRLNAAMFMEHGGPHLGAVRGQIQIMFRNGEHVIWGSRNELSPPATVKDLEKLAAHVAESVLRNVHEYMPKNNVFQKLADLQENCRTAIRTLRQHSGQMVSSDSEKAASILTEALERSES